MGGGSWTNTAFNTYTTSTRGMDAATYASYSNLRVQDAFKATGLHRDMDPRGVMRECLDTEEHPNTVPVILALDVTGSMGKAATEVSQKLGIIMESIYDSKKVPDVEFCIMAIGDLYCDRAPIQISQFESDIRIAESLDKVYFERGGGSNDWESYTAAWYMGLNHCKLDCWNRGQRGIIITIGDEQLNPYLQKSSIRHFVGDEVQADIETDKLYARAVEMYDIHHISVNDEHCCYARNNYNGKVDESWSSLLGQKYHISTIDGLQKMITDIVTGESVEVSTVPSGNEDGAVFGEISW